MTHTYRGRGFGYRSPDTNQSAGIYTNHGTARPATVNRQPPPAGLVAAAERDYHAMQEELAGLVQTVRLLLAAGFTELEAGIDVWQTLCCGNPRVAAFLGATAVMELAKRAEA